MRVVSVLPSATEIVASLGHRHELVGRSEECDFPPDVGSLPVVMRPRTWDRSAPSGVIDARVQDTRSRGESLYVLDVPLLARLQPDVLFTQDLCGVCSVTPDEVHTACSQAGVTPEVVSLTPTTLEEVWQSVEQVGDALGDPSSARRAAGELRARVRRRPLTPAPRVAVVEWLDPPILAGLWTPAMVAAAGGDSVGPSVGKPGVRTSWEEIARLAPDLLVLSPCSFSVARTLEELRATGLAQRILGVRPARGILLADEAYFSRPGPRLAAGVELLGHRLREEVWEPPMPAQTWLPAGVTA